MKILLGTDTYPPTINGAAQFCFRLARGLARLGHDVHVACPSPTGRAETISDDEGVTLHRIRSARYRRYGDFPLSRLGTVAREARNVLDRVRPDVVHVQHSFLLGRALLRHARNAGIGTIATNHVMPENLMDHVPLPDFMHGWASRMVWRDMKRVYRNAGIVTSPTPRAVDLLQHATGLKAVAVSNGVDLQPYERESREAVVNQVPVVLFVGRLDQEKRVDNLIHAMAALPAHVPGRLEIVGDGPCRAEWEDLGERLGLGDDRVFFHGFVSESDLLSRYGSADVFCMPSIAELQSLATLEAMAASTPVVAADAVALRHLVDHGRNGYLHKAGDVSDLSSRLAELLIDPDTRRRMGRVSKSMVAKHSMEHTLDSFENLYASIMRGTKTWSRPITAETALTA